MGSKLDAMRAAAANKPPAKPVTVAGPQTVKTADGAVLGTCDSVTFTPKAKKGKSPKPKTPPVGTPIPVNEAESPECLAIERGTPKPESVGGACGGVAVMQLAGTIGKNPLKRLPDGSHMEMDYTSTGHEQGYWDGLLVIPQGKDQPPLRFGFRKGGIHMMHAALSKKYWAHLKQKKAEGSMDSVLPSALLESNS